MLKIKNVNQNYSITKPIDYLKKTNKKIKEATSFIFQSSLFFALFSSSIIFSSLYLSYVVSINFLSIAAISLVALSLLIKKQPKDLLYEIAMTDTYVRYFLSEKTWPWYHKIDENIYLGALPLKNLNHETKLLKEEKIKAVLSIVETFEVEKKTLFSDPITFDTWKKNKIEHLQIPTPDTYPLKKEDMLKAANFIERQVRKNKKVYVHCKAGRGRSASAIIAYLMKYKKMGKLDAINYLKSKRGVIYLNSSQFRSISDFLK